MKTKTDFNNARIQRQVVVSTSIQLNHCKQRWYTFKITHELPHRIKQNQARIYSIKLNG